MNELLRFNKQGGVNGYILERIWHTLFEKKYSFKEYHNQ